MLLKLLIVIKLGSICYSASLGKDSNTNQIEDSNDVFIIKRPIKYNFSYEVNAAETGDLKKHSESRQDNSVRGRYEVLDPDGYLRIVEYMVDGNSGFIANVRREPIENFEKYRDHYSKFERLRTAATTTKRPITLDSGHLSTENIVFK